jgi:hypothetical protein
MVRTIRVTLSFCGACYYIYVKATPAEVASAHWRSQLKNRLEANPAVVEMTVVEAPNEFQTR